VTFLTPDKKVSKVAEIKEDGSCEIDKMPAGEFAEASLNGLTMPRERVSEAGPKVMHETAPESIPLPHLSPEESAPALAPSSPSPPSPPPKRLARFVGSILAGPRAVLRHPLRSLTIAALLLLIGTGVGIAGVWLWASHHLRAGRADLEHYHTIEAVAHLQAVLSVWPHDPETLLLAARAARRAGAYDTADHFLDLYQEQRKDDDDLTIERICLRAQRGEPDRVFKYCQGMIEDNDPASPLLFEALAQGYWRNYQPQRAEMVLHKWLEQQPDNPQALFLQGEVYDLVSRQSDAIKSFRAALSVDPTLDQVRIRLCDILMQLGSVPEARPHLEYLYARLPDNAKVQVYLARVWDQAGNQAEAERILDALLARQPHFAPALRERGKLARRDPNRLDEAENYLRQAVQQDPSDSDAHESFALCLEQNGKLAEADKIREQVKQMEKDMHEIQSIARGQMEQAPHNADLHYKVGMISLRAGATAEGLRWLHSALKEDPNHQGAHKALMEYYQRIGDFGRAREHKQKMVK
jgi:tetratricopeptide (TPR) repeat protein